MNKENQIDAVYTWVNHNDPAWRNMYERASKVEEKIKNEHDSARNSARFYSRNELYYSIKSLKKYAPWVRKIYVVSNCKRPEWLDGFHGIQYIEHQSIFSDLADLPTFNSHAIETVIHRIEGLSERFLYLNDDVFLCNSMRPHDFFPDDGGVYFFPSRHDIPYACDIKQVRPVDQGAINASRLLKESFGQIPRKKLQHAPFPLLRSTLMEIERRYPSEVLATRSHAFRHPEDIAMATTLHAYYAYYSERGEPRDIAARYIDIGDPKFLLLIHPWSPLMRGKYDTLCLNEVADIKHLAPIRDRVVRWAMSRLFD